MVVVVSVTMMVVPAHLNLELTIIHGDVSRIGVEPCLQVSRLRESKGGVNLHLRVCVGPGGLATLVILSGKAALNGILDLGAEVSAVEPLLVQDL